MLYDSTEFRANGNVEGGLKLGYTGGYGAWEVAAFARNITNEKHVKGVIENYMAVVYTEPRVVGVSVNVNWQQERLKSSQRLHGALVSRSR